MNDGILKDIHEIASDRSLPIDERVDRIFNIGHSDDADPAVKPEVYRTIIDLIQSEDAVATHVGELLELYVLLAEAYQEMEIFPPLNGLAFDVRELLRDNRIAWDVIEDTLPALIEVMSDTVFHHETYRLQLVYLRTAFANGKLTGEMKDMARDFLKLTILLDESGWGSYLMDKDFEKALASLFESYELLRIIMNPNRGRLKADPVEYTTRWEEIFYDVERRLDERFANAPRQRGFCFKYWQAKKDLLKEEYGIDWRSPAQMNPRVRFD